MKTQVITIALLILGLVAHGKELTREEIDYKADFIIKGIQKIEIVNIVGTADVGGDVDLEAAADVLNNVMYEPEQFPGLIYRMEEPKVVILIFRSGKMVLTGAKREKQIHEAAEKISSIIIENELVY